MEDLISVIVPVYNVEKYLKRCVDSILNQTYKNLEIILVDDGSTDDSGKICDEYAKRDNRIKVIHKENGGLSDARNLGIEVSNGNYIGFVDSDDWISEKMYEILLKNLIEYNADLSCCELIRTKNTKEPLKNNKFDKKISMYSLDEYIKIFFKIGTQKCIYYACNKLYKKSIIESNLYPIGLTSEDVEGTFKTLIKCERIVHINFPYYYYYINDNSITGKKFSKKDFDLIQIWNNVLEVCNEKKPEYLPMANLNRRRIDYTLLMRMAMQLSYKEIGTEYKDDYEKLLSNLKQNEKFLLNSQIPLSRKLTIIMICTNYKLFVIFCKIVKIPRRVLR